VFDVPEGRTRRAFRARLAARGIAEGRVDLVGRLPIDAYFRAFGDIDIALDTTPYNGATTTLDTLWMGVPVIALEGGTSIARGTASLLHTLGRPEWIATTPAEYVALNLRLADDVATRANIARALRSQLVASPLMDAPGFVRNLESALARMTLQGRSTTG
jgi:predicted O-linked N-acetylglucosamine transferase (SPINDLY family)